MAVLSSRIKATICGALFTASLLPLCANLEARAEQRVIANLDGFAGVAPNVRDAALKKLAAQLVNQARKYQADAVAASQIEISKVNLAKLRPALNRQRQTLMTAEPLLGLLETNSAEAKSAGISGEIVGSLPKTAISSKPADPMKRFRLKLAGLEAGTVQKPLTILHLGRSVEGSVLFDESLRASLKRQYGDSGIGMISPAHDYRLGQAKEYELTRAGRWRTDSLRVRSKTRFGLSTMQVASRSSLSSMTVTSNNGPFDWVGVTIATGPSQGTFQMKVGEVEREFDAHAHQSGSRFFKMAVSGNSATIRPGGGAQTAILNWSMGSNKAGIRHVRFDPLSDNASEVQRLDVNLLTNDLRTLSPDLIVIESVPHGSESHGQADDLVAQVRAAAPQAAIVFMRADADQAAFQKSCLDGSMSFLAKGPTADTSKLNNASIWAWTPTRADICAIEDQLQQGLVGADVANLTPDYADRKAAAFAKWLTRPTAKGSDLALLPAAN